MSFVNATVVLSIGESVEEVADSGFLLTTPTVSVTQLGDDSLLQVRPLSRAAPSSDLQSSQTSGLHVTTALGVPGGHSAHPERPPH